MDNNKIEDAHVIDKFLHAASGQASPPLSKILQTVADSNAEYEAFQATLATHPGSIPLPPPPPFLSGKTKSGIHLVNVKENINHHILALAALVEGGFASSLNAANRANKQFGMSLENALHFNHDAKQLEKNDQFTQGVIDNVTQMSHLNLRYKQAQEFVAKHVPLYELAKTEYKKRHGHDFHPDEKLAGHKMNLKS